MGPGGFDMQQIFAAAQQALSAQQELANTEVIGTAGGGAVRAVVSGVGQLIDLTIDPSAIDPADPAESASTIADLVLAAVRDAWDAAVDLQQRQLGALGGGGSAARLADSTCPASACPASAAGFPTRRTRTTKRRRGPRRRRRGRRLRRRRPAPAGAPHDEPRRVPRRAQGLALPDVRRRHPAPHRRARQAARRRAQGRAADRVPPACRRPGGRQAAGRRAHRDDRARAVLQDLRERRRGRGVPDLPGHPAGPRGDLRRRGAEGRRRGGEDPRVPRPVSRARRRDQPDRRDRPRRPAGQGADDPAGRRRPSPS